MLTRSRLGFFANENAPVAGKAGGVGAQKCKQKQAVVTRSRAALGDIKNRVIDHSKHENTQHFLKKPSINQKPPKSDTKDLCKASVLLIHQQSEELKVFRENRAAIRERCLNKSYSSAFLDWENEDCGDTATVNPYSESIFNYLQNREFDVQPLHEGFMNSESEVNPRMRYILINWMVQIHHSYKLQPETLYLCVALLDRFLLIHSSTLTKDRFQLVGIASLFVAAKFEEMFPPDIADFTAVTHSAFTKVDIRSCEQTILQAVDFFLSIPIPLVFLRRLSRAVDADRTMHNLAKYLLELTIQEYDLAYMPGNLRAVVALLLSRAICLCTSNLNEAWKEVMSFLSGYSLDDVKGPLRILARAAYRQNSPSKYRAIFDKYRLDDFFGKVAALPELRSSLMETLADLKFDSDGEANLV